MSRPISRWAHRPHFRTSLFGPRARMRRLIQAAHVFGVCWRGLPARSLDGRLARDRAIIHSVKDHPPFTEAATRAFLRAGRTPERANSG